MPIEVRTTIAQLNDPRIRKRADGKYEIDALDGGTEPHVFNVWIHAMDALQVAARTEATGAVGPRVIWCGLGLLGGVAMMWLAASTRR